MISIVVPVYKVEKYLKRCVDSLLNQTFKDIEVVLVDDGSPDNCPKICDDYSKIDERIVVIHKKNGGLSSARNAGLDKIKGDFVFFIDSDDWLASNDVLEKMYDKAVKEKADFVFAKNNSASDDEQHCGRLIKKYKQIDLLFLSNPYFFTAWNKLFERSLFPYLRFTEGRINEDVDIIPLVFLKSKKIAFYDECTYNYYVNPLSITRKNFSEKRFDMFKSVNHVYKEFSGTDKQKKVFYENLFGFQLFSLYIDILKKTSGNERKFNISKFLQLLKYYDFKNYFKICFSCFLKYENFLRFTKKTIALIYLMLFSVFVYKEKKNA